MPQPNAAQMERINKLARLAVAPKPNGEVMNAISALCKMFGKTGIKPTDCKIVLADAHPSHANAATENLQSQIADLMNRLHAAHCEIANLKAARTYGFPDQRVQANSRDASNAKAEANALRAKVAKLEATLAKTMAESDESNRARDEADARADAARRENDELRAALQEATAELREAHCVADVRRDAAANNGSAEVADAVTDNPTDSAEAEAHHPEAAEGLAESGSFEKMAADEQNGWNPNFDKKAVGFYWRTVQAINADLAAGRITKRQASGRKAVALRSYKAGAKPVSRSRTG